MKEDLGNLYLDSINSKHDGIENPQGSVRVD